MPRPSSFLDPRRTIFIGGVPRPRKASELALFSEVFMAQFAMQALMSTQK
ncbi:unnamed protein product [Meloidogyne enterolobii]|uniref:Uncharacterized protein n=2 Tax=Meloidogyne enterolobii TaxID=390850 RepID=A0A6V7VN07_MELEN|nr:unnamed protein product [Meloidogyne enterolobii]